MGARAWRKSPGSSCQISLCRENDIYLNPEASAGVSPQMIGGGKWNDAHKLRQHEKDSGYV